MSEYDSSGWKSGAIVVHRIYGPAVDALRKRADEIQRKIMHRSCDCKSCEAKEVVLETLREIADALDITEEALL
jgi:hypothetical protein